MTVHLRLKGRVGLGFAVGALEIEDQRHQRLGDEAAAIDAEMPALIRPATIGIQLIRRGSCAHDALARGCSDACLAALMKLATSFASFSPRARSTPEETSTSVAPVTLIASPTVSAVNPPERAKGGFTPVSDCQSKGTPLPPENDALGEALASN